MDRDAATGVVNQWVRAHAADHQQDVYAVSTYLTAELMALASNDAVAGVGRCAGDPAVIAADEESLLVLSAQVHDSTVHLTCRRLPLCSGLEIYLDETISPRNHRLLRERTWTYKWAGGEAVSVETTETLQAQFASDVQPSSGELVARRAARAAGWSIPEPDPSKQIY